MIDGEHGANAPLPTLTAAQSLVLQRIERMLALRHSAEPVDDDILTSSGITHLKNKTTDELLANRKFPQDQLKRYEQALRTATPVLNERKQ